MFQFEFFCTAKRNKDAASFFFIPISLYFYSRRGGMPEVCVAPLLVLIRIFLHSYPNYFVRNRRASILSPQTHLGDPGEGLPHRPGSGADAGGRGAPARGPGARKLSFHSRWFPLLY